MLIRYKVLKCHMPSNQISKVYGHITSALFFKTYFILDDGTSIRLSLNARYLFEVGKSIGNDILRTIQGSV